MTDILPLNQILLGNNLELLATLPDNSLDAIVTDPEYGTASKTKVQKRGNKLVEFNISWDGSFPTAWIALATKKLKPGGSLISFTDNKRVETLWNALKANGLNPLQNLYWYKTNPPPQPRKNFQSAIETAVFARKPGKIIYWGGGGATPNVFQYPIVTGPERTAHPTQKPVPVMRWLISLVCPVGGVVCDPFAGSGTTCEAAWLRGRNYIGMEFDPEYHAIATARLANVQPNIQFSEMIG